MYWVLYLTEYFLLRVLKMGQNGRQENQGQKKGIAREINKQKKNRRMRCRLMISDVNQIIR